MSAMDDSGQILHDSKLPLYHQLYELLRNKIRRREWKPGVLMPSESKLMVQYGVSRVTVRQAFEALANDGLVYRQRGRGTFVAHPRIEQGLTRIITFTEDMRQRGFRPGTEVLSATIIPAPEKVANTLQVSLGEEVVRLVRLRLADDEPMSIEEAYLIHKYCPGLLDRDYRAAPLREVLDREFGLRWGRSKQTIRAVAASKETADHLRIPAGSPLLAIERISYSDKDVPAEYLMLLHRGDRYALHGELRG
jgi:GntR family transcriptional regulator